MSLRFADYIALEFEWMLARRAAGGVLSDDEEVAWTERAMELYRALSPEEQAEVDDLSWGEHASEPIAAPSAPMIGIPSALDLVDRNVGPDGRVPPRRAA